LHAQATEWTHAQVAVQAYTCCAHALVTQAPKDQAVTQAESVFTGVKAMG